MAQQDTILNTAINEIGTMEEATTRYTPYSTSYYGTQKGVDWCVIFVWWVFQQAGLSSLFCEGNKCAGCTSFMNKMNGHYTTNPQKGDIALFNWDGRPSPQHMGIVESVSDDKITTIEGNTTATGYARNCVARKTRNKSFVVRYIHPAYSDTVVTPSTITEHPDNYGNHEMWYYDFNQNEAVYSVEEYESNPDTYEWHIFDNCWIGYFYHNAQKIFVTPFVGLSTSNWVFDATEKSYTSANNQWVKFLITEDDVKLKVLYNKTTQTYYYLTGGLIDIQYWIDGRNYVYWKNHNSSYNPVDGTPMSYTNPTVSDPGLFFMNYRGGQSNNGTNFNSVTGAVYEEYSSNTVPTPGVKGYGSIRFTLMVDQSNSYICRWLTLSEPVMAVTTPAGITLNLKFGLTIKGIGDDGNYTKINYPIAEENIMTLHLWKNFKKKLNSTKIPTTQGITIDVSLKRNCSVYQPSFILNKEFDADDWHEYNYCRIFGNYYHINNVISLNGGLVQIDCSIDAPASVRDDIFDSSQFVNFTNKDSAINEDIINNKTVMTNKFEVYTSEITVKEETGTPLFDKTNKKGCYIVGVQNNVLAKQEGVTYYLMPEASLEDLMILFNNYNWVQSIFSNIDDAMNFITGCWWTPIDLNNLSLWSSPIITPASELVIGSEIVANSLQSGALYTLNTDVFKSKIETVTIPRTYTDFKKTSPYSDYKMFIPMNGYQDISADLLYNEDAINVQNIIDLPTGKSILLIMDSNNNILQTFDYNLYVSISLSQIVKDYDNIVKSGLAVAGGAVGLMAMSNPVGAVLGTAGIVAGFVNGMKASHHPQVSNVLGEGGLSYRELSFDNILCVYEYEISDTQSNYNVIGAPVMRVDTLSGYEGYYVQCENAHIDLELNASVKQSVESYLNSGIWLE